MSDPDDLDDLDGIEDLDDFDEIDANSNAEQTRLLIAVVVLLSLFMASLVAHQYGGFNFVLNIFSGERSDSEAEGSLQLAVYACKQEIRASVGSNLLQMDVDRLSTRYVSARQSYLVFVDIMVKGQERVPIYVECDVAATDQRINRIRVNGPPRGFDIF